jgi:hypothetical protein
MNMKIICLSCLLFLFALVACNEESDIAINYDGDFATLTEQIDSLIIINNDTSISLNINGVKLNDKLLMRSAEDSNREILVRWGYFYTGKDANNNSTYDENRVVVKLEFDDRWITGDWQVVLQRDNQRQILSTVKCLLLRLKDEDSVDASELYKGFLYVSAAGWSGKGTDYYEFTNSKTGKTVAVDMTEEAQALPAPYEKLLIGLPKDSLETGSYSLSLRRWTYDFRQKICDFDYFKIAFVDDKPVTLNAEGEYAFDFYLDEIWTGDRINIGYGAKGVRYTLSEEHFNPETHVYHVVIESKDLPKESTTLSASITRNGVNLLIGDKEIILSN